MCSKIGTHNLVNKNLSKISGLDHTTTSILEVKEEGTQSGGSGGCRDSQYTRKAGEIDD